MINPKNSLKDLEGVLKFNFTMLQKYIKIIPIKYAVKYITYNLTTLHYYHRIKRNNNDNNINHKNAYKTQLPSFTLLS